MYTPFVYLYVDKGDLGMYVSERDQVNYHGFLYALREMHQASLDCVCKGICSTSGMNRFERGNRMPEKQICDRITARLGVSGEKYEDYLQPRQYVLWQQRLRIVKAIEKRDLSYAKYELEAYEKQKNLNVVNKQFIETMRYQILMLEGASDGELLKTIEKAIKYTVPNIAKALIGEHLLSDQEMNLISERVRLLPPPAAVKDPFAWRIAEYEKLLLNIDNSYWEKLLKVKVYPKIVYYICKELLSSELDEEKSRYGLQICNAAIELLRDTTRAYYFIELTEMRRTFANALLEYASEVSEKESLQELLQENDEWEQILKGMYTEYQIESYMSDFCYLYYETECHDMVEVIESRRKMLGLSRVKICNDVCAEKTLVRVERKGTNPTIELARLLFDKIGLCAEYRRARVVTSSIDTLMLWNETLKSMNNYDFEKWERNIGELESCLNMEIAHNKQEIGRLNAMLKHRSKQIDGEEFYQMSRNALEQTLPLSSIEVEGRKHFSRNELSSLFDFAFETKGDISERCLDILFQKYGSIKSTDDVDDSQLCMYEFITGGLVNYLGNNERYEESNEISNIMLKECLIHRRMGSLADNIYNMVWNYQQTETPSLLDHNYVKRQLTRCWVLSKINKKSYRIAFFQNKLSE